MDVQNVPVGSSASEYACDGTKGLVCGDMCALTTAENLPGDTAATCTCGPQHVTSGATCSPSKYCQMYLI